MTIVLIRIWLLQAGVKIRTLTEEEGTSPKKKVLIQGSWFLANEKSVLMANEPAPES
jgi:hypothetical protein